MHIYITIRSAASY